MFASLKNFLHYTGQILCMKVSRLSTSWYVTWHCYWEMRIIRGMKILRIIWIMKSKCLLTFLVLHRGSVFLSLWESNFIETALFAIWFNERNWFAYLDVTRIFVWFCDSCWVWGPVLHCSELLFQLMYKYLSFYLMLRPAKILHCFPMLSSC